MCAPLQSERDLPIIYNIPVIDRSLSDCVAGALGPRLWHEERPPHGVEECSGKCTHYSCRSVVQTVWRRYSGAELTLMWVSFAIEPVGACPDRAEQIGASGRPVSLEIGTQDFSGFFNRKSGFKLTGPICHIPATANTR